MASRGYGESGVGAEVALGDGVIGTVARERRLIRLTSLEADLRYGRAIRREIGRGRAGRSRPEIPLPGLKDAQSSSPSRSVGDRLVGVHRRRRAAIRMRSSEWHEAFLEIVANQIALGIDRMIERGDEAADAGVPADTVPSPARRRRRAARSRPAARSAAHVLPERRLRFSSTTST